MPSLSTDRNHFVQIHSPANPPTDGCARLGTLGVRSTDGTLWWFTAAGWVQLLAQGQSIATDAELAAAVVQLQGEIVAASALDLAAAQAEIVASEASDQVVLTVAVSPLTGNESLFYVHPPGASDLDIQGVVLVSNVDLTAQIALTMAIDGTSVKDGANPLEIIIAAGQGAGADASATATADRRLVAGAKVKIDTVTTNATDGLAALFINCRRV